MKIRYALTYTDKDGYRVLVGPNQGRWFRDTSEEMEEYRGHFLKNNTDVLLASVFGPQSLGTFEVRPVECYDNGDACSWNFEE